MYHDYNETNLHMLCSLDWATKRKPESGIDVEKLGK